MTQLTEPLTLTGRLLRARGVAAYFAMVATALALAVVVTPRALHVVRGAELHFKPAEDLRLKAPLLAWPGTARGDRVVAMNGARLELHEVSWAAIEATPPGLVTVTFEREGRQFEVLRQLAEKAPVHRWAILMRYGTGMGLLLIALVAFLVRAGTRESWLLCVFFFGLGVFVLMEWIFPTDTLARAVQYLLMPLIASVGLHCFVVFPRELPELARRRWATLALYSPVVPLAPLSLWYIASGYTSAVGRVALSLSWLLLPSAVLVGAALMVTQAVRAKRRGDRASFALHRAVLIAMSALVLPSLVIAVMKAANLGSGQRWLYQSSVAALLLFAGMMTYLLIRHNPLQVDRFTVSVLGYAATLALVAGAFGVALLVLLRVAGRGGALQPAVYVGLTVIATLSLNPIYRHVKGRIDRWFHRDATDHHRALEVLQRLATEVQGLEREEACGLVLDSLTLLRADAASLWTLSDDGQRFFRAAVRPRTSQGGAAELARAGPLGAAMQKGLSGGLAELAPRALPAEAQAELWARALAMAVPVRAQEALLGFLAVGRKLSGASYLETDLAFLGAIGAQIASVLARPTEGTQVGRYRVERRIGVGGMAEVFLAWQMGPGGFERKVALKRPLPDLSEDTACAAMFLDEARISSHLQHRNIAQVYEIDRHRGAYFIAMEYVDGPSLRSALRSAGESGQVPVTVALRIGCDVLSALAHAHQTTDRAGQTLSLVHRDVTPSNVLLTSAGEVKLVDFGIARAGARLFRTQTGMVRGTIPYMSPEHAEGRELDLRADIFSAGAVLYELFTLERAWPRGAGGPPPAPAARIRPGLPATLDSVLARAMAQDPGGRYSSASELRAALLGAFSPLEPATEEAVAAWIRALPTPSGAQEHAATPGTLGDETAVLSPDEASPPRAVSET